MFHVRRRPAESAQPRRRKKKPLGINNGGGNMTVDREGPVLIEITHSGDGGRRLKLTTEPVEVGSANTNPLQLFGPSIQARHCLISLHEGVCTVTPLHPDGLTFVNGHHITQPTILHVSKFVDSDIPKLIGFVKLYQMRSMKHFHLNKQNRNLDWKENENSSLTTVLFTISFNSECFLTILFIEWFCGDVRASCIISLCRRSIRWALQLGTVAIAARLGLSLREVSNSTIYL